MFQCRLSAVPVQLLGLASRKRLSRGSWSWIANTSAMRFARCVDAYGFALIWKERARDPRRHICLDRILSRARSSGAKGRRIAGKQRCRDLWPNPHRTAPGLSIQCGSGSNTALARSLPPTFPTSAALGRRGRNGFCIGAEGSIRKNPRPAHCNLRARPFRCVIDGGQ